jgi:hypothetical protein
MRFAVVFTYCLPTCSSAVLSAINDDEFPRFIFKSWPSVDLRSTMTAAVKGSVVD